jgi:hypothetical protein
MVSIWLAENKSPNWVARISGFGLRILALPGGSILRNLLENELAPVLHLVAQ